jgi:hypothetical protein
MKYCHESRGTQIRERLRWRCPAKTENYRAVLSSERALQNNKAAAVYRKFHGERKKNWSRVPDGRLTPGQTGRLTVGCKLTSTSTSTSISELVTVISQASIQEMPVSNIARCTDQHFFVLFLRSSKNIGGVASILGQDRFLSNPF